MKHTFQPRRGQRGSQFTPPLAVFEGRLYACKDELVQKEILRESVYNEIKDKIIAKQ